MRRSSLRTWLLLISILFAVVTVGGISIVTYIVVEDGLDAVSLRAVQHLADISGNVISQKQAEAKDLAQDSNVSGAAFGQAADEAFVQLLDQRWRVRGAEQSEYALYAQGVDALWSTSARALIPADQSAREQALAEGTTTYSTAEQGKAFSGMFAAARLSAHVANVPIQLPSGKPAVLAISYFPGDEETVIDSIRAPMALLAIIAIITMVAMMQSWMTWVLRLVNQLREAADSIDAGKLDVRLPEQGSNEVGDLARSINRLIDRLRRRADAQTRFVADASHELATPVAGIRGYTNILRAWGADDPDVRDEAVNAIDRESRRMARLTGNLLTLVRSEQALEIRSVRFDLNMSCREVLAVAGTRYADKQQRLIGPEEGSLLMMGDPDRTEDVISILVDNAAKYTPEHGRVSVQTRRKRDIVIIEVSDTGPGIPAADLPNIFERFYRSDASRSRGTGGFGLGLAIAKSLAEELGGTIDVQSELGRGTTFTVRLPRGRV